jgi:uncharacterized protein (TIGR03382 family)
MKKHTVVFAVTGIMMGLSAPAPAYVRTRTTAGVPTAWRSPCVTMEFALGAFPAKLEGPDYLEAARQGAAAWTQASLDGTNRCSNVLLGVESNADVAGPVGKDSHNRIIFRQTEWCRDPAPTDPTEPRCYDASALAITTVFQLKNSGEILDTDIEVNGVSFTWGDFVGRPGLMTSGTHDFQGAITHELGHVLGLEHTCYVPAHYKDGTPVPRPVDNTGAPIPNCGPDNPPAIADATMYVSVSSPMTEVGLRTLSPDDVQGVCDIYPFSPTFVCSAPITDAGTTLGKGGGCSFGQRQGSGSIALALAVIALALSLRRRRGR